VTPPITTAHTREIGSYFQRNYRQGEPIEVPSHVTDWIAWKNRKLKKMGFYDKYNMRFGKHKKTEDEPPRIHLRGAGDFSAPSLSDGHLEFKVWLQHKVEEVSAGNCSPRFLAKQGRESERNDAMDKWEKLSENLKKEFENHFLTSEKISNTRFRVPRHLMLLRKIIGHVEPDFDSINQPYIMGKGLDFHLDQFGDLFGSDGYSIVEKICRETIKTLIAESRSSFPSSRELFQFWEVEAGCKQLRELAVQKGVAILEGDEGPDLTKKLVEAEVEPPEEWKKWVNISLPGMTFISQLSGRIATILNDSRTKAISFVKEGSYVLEEKCGLGDSEFDEKKSYEELKNRGFGSSNLSLDIPPEEITNQNAISLTYNILNMLLENGSLRDEYMTRKEFLEHFLDGDDSLEKSRGSKRYPHKLIFSESFKLKIGKSGYDEFKAGNEHPIYRWLRGEQIRWMYSPPAPHRSNKLNERGGLLSERNRKVIGGSHDAYESFEPPTPRCKLSSEIIQSLNTLQKTQWEINLDFVSAFFDIELEAGKHLDIGGWDEKDAVIKVFKPKGKFSDVFTPIDTQSRENRTLVLEWARRIIEHNANVFWHSWICDFRGRMSPRCSKLSPHGDDLDRALIRFKEWKPIGDEGIDWFRVHVHNMMEGIDSPLLNRAAEKKQTFEARTKWVQDNLVGLRELARNPVENRVELQLDRYRSGKSEAFQRLACLIELNRLHDAYEESGEDWSKVKSGQPVYLDASCNGYQHLSAMFRDRDLAMKVNVINDDTETEVKPNDLYEIVTDNADQDDTQSFLRELLNTPEEVKTALERTYSRETAKLPTMTRVYGSTDISKCLQGRNGRGKPRYGEPIPKTDAQREADEKLKEKIPQGAQDAYLDFVEGRGTYAAFKSFAKKDGWKNSENKAQKWVKILRDDHFLPLWNEGSGLQKAILEHDDRISKRFKDEWQNQPILTKLVADSYESAIGVSTSKAYDTLESALGLISKSCDGLHPGVSWELPDGFIVNNYYIKQHQADKSRGKMPCWRGSAYSALVPDWYKKEKTSKCIYNRVKELYSTSKLLDDELSDAIKGKLYSSLVRQILNKVDPEQTDGEADEIRRVLFHSDYTLLLYAEKEKGRLNKKKLKTGLAPNFVHSLDAFHMRSSINSLTDEIESLSFWAVHDAFGTHACDVPKMKEIVTTSFYDLHDSRNFRYWLDMMAERFGIDFSVDPIGMKGDQPSHLSDYWPIDDGTAPLDLSEALDSTYLIC
jgi:hypothetical protein